MQLNERLIKFLIVGSSAAIVNFALMVFFVEALSFKTHILKNIANVVSIEISLFYNFLLSRVWTWGDTPKRQGKWLISQFIFFHLAAFTGILIRIVIFAILDRLGTHYLINLFIGMGVAAVVDFILYDKFIFPNVVHEKETL